MSTPPFPDPWDTQQTASPIVPPSWARPLLPAGKWIGLLLALYLFGPMLFYARIIQHQAAGSSFQAEERWANANGSALLWPLVYLPIALFHTALASFWATLFATLALHTHLSWLAFLGNTTLIPPLPTSILLRWLLACPLAGLFALSMEAVHPQTRWQSKRIITPDEQAELDALHAAAEKKRLAAEKRKQTRAAAASSAPHTETTNTKQKRTRSGRNKAIRAPQIPKAGSLWDTIDWTTVPDKHPLKQAAREEAEHLDAQRREGERARWLTQQASGSPEPAPTVDATPPSPSSDDSYNWDEGEGSIRD